MRYSPRIILVLLLVAPAALAQINSQSNSEPDGLGMFSLGTSMRLCGQSVSTAGFTITRPDTTTFTRTADSSGCADIYQDSEGRWQASWTEPGLGAPSRTHRWDVDNRNGFQFLQPDEATRAKSGYFFGDPYRACASRDVLVSTFNDEILPVVGTNAAGAAALTLLDVAGVDEGGKFGVAMAVDGRNQGAQRAYGAEAHAGDATASFAASFTSGSLIIVGYGANATQGTDAADFVVHMTNGGLSYAHGNGTATTTTNLLGPYQGRLSSWIQRDVVGAQTHLTFRIFDAGGRVLAEGTRSLDTVPSGAGAELAIGSGSTTTVGAVAELRFWDSLVDVQVLNRIANPTLSTHRSALAGGEHDAYFFGAVASTSTAPVFRVTDPDGELQEIGPDSNRCLSIEWTRPGRWTIEWTEDANGARSRIVQIAVADPCDRVCRVLEWGRDFFLPVTAAVLLMFWMVSRSIESTPIWIVGSVLAFVAVLGTTLYIYGAPWHQTLLPLFAALAVLIRFIAANFGFLQNREKT